MKADNKEEKKRLFLNFSNDYEFEKPCFPEKNGKPYVYFGADNKYPNKLLDLFENSGKHGTITRGKSDYIIGQGFNFNKNTTTTVEQAKAEAWIKRANSWGESWNELGEKVSLDLEIFNGAYIQVVFNKLTGKPTDFYHIDFHTVRSNKNNTEFYISEDWCKSNPKFDPYPGFNINRKDNTQILFIKPYSPGSKTYPLPRYVGGLRWVEIDIEIATFNLSALHNDLAVSKLLNFSGDVPDTPEGKDEIEKEIRKKFASARNGGKWMFSFNDSAENAVTALDLSEGNLHERFEQLSKTCQQEIFTAHNVTSPMLFGIKTEGQLGGRSELREAYELFKNTYINSRQQTLLRNVNLLAKLSGVNTELDIIPTEPIGIEFSETTLLTICDKNELREKIGLEVKEIPEESKVLTALGSLSPLVANAVLDSLTANEVRALIGVPPATEPIAPKQFNFTAEDDERDIIVFGEHGEPRANFVSIKKSRVLFKSQAECEDETEAAYRTCFAKGLTVTIENIKSEILGLLQKNPGLNAEEIAKVFEIEPDLVNDTISLLIEEKALIEIDHGKDPVTYKPTSKGGKIIKNEGPESLDILVKYSYYGPKDSKNRPFCAKMLDLDRVYSRKDIETISQKVGYSVWERRGGFYTNPNTGTTTPFCRHFWLQEIMIKKAQ